MSKITHVNLDGGQYAMSDPRFENDKFFQYNLGAIAETSDTSQNETLQKIYDAAASGGSVAAVYNGIILEVSEVSTDKMILSSKINLTFTEVEAKITSGTVESAVSRKVTPITYGEDEPEIGVTPLPAGTIYCRWGGVVEKEGLMFSSPNPFTLKFTSMFGKPEGVNIEISKDGTNFETGTWDEDEGGVLLVADTLTESNGYTVYIKVDNLVMFANFSCVTGSNITVSGKLDYLWGQQFPGEGSMSDMLFANFTELVSAKDLVFPADYTISYSFLFQNCTGLVTPPSILPATTLSENCYGSMFDSCTSLTSAPELPATTLADSCYNTMFVGCSSLTTCPELPATNLPQFCYANMFQDCTSLTAPCVFPTITNLGYQAFTTMFSGCTGITWCSESTSGSTEYKITTTDGSTSKEHTPQMFYGNGGTPLPEGTGTPKLNTTYYYVG